MAAKRALIMGITGQDGSYLAELLLGKGYEVIGLHRRSSTVTFDRIDHLTDRLTLVAADLLDEASLIRALREYRPAEVYNLAAQSFVQTSFGQPILTGEVTALGVTRMLDAILLVDPAILFNHESPRRGLEFVTRKVTFSAAAIKLGLQKSVALGNLDAQRDWGYAADYVQAMWLMLQQDEPADYVVATGETHSVRELCQIAFDQVGLNWEDHVRVDQQFFRPAEVDLLIGDAKKARTELRWEPQVGFEELVRMMVDADLEALRGDGVS